MVKRKKRKVGDVIHTQTIVAARGFNGSKFLPAGERKTAFRGM
jgi:hypothetical protein